MFTIYTDIEGGYRLGAIYYPPCHAGGAGEAGGIGGGQVEAEGGFAETGLAGEDGEVAAG